MLLTIKKVYSLLNKTNVKCNVYVNFVIKNKNKKSTESDVAPAGIKSYKFLFILKKKLFCSIQETDGLVLRKMDKVENLEYWLGKFDLNLSIISQDIDIERISVLPINQGQ